MFGAIDCGASWRGSFGAGGYGAQRVGEKESEKSKQYEKISLFVIQVKFVPI